MALAVLQPFLQVWRDSSMEASSGIGECCFYTFTFPLMLNIIVVIIMNHKSVVMASIKKV